MFTVNQKTVDPEITEDERIDQPNFGENGTPGIYLKQKPPTKCRQGFLGI